MDLDLDDLEKRIDDAFEGENAESLRVFLESKRRKRLKKKHILKLKPEFKFGDMTMIDWFKITEGVGFFCIQSGLRHADGETKSPYYYEECLGGKKAKKRALKNFNEWWYNI